MGGSGNALGGHYTGSSEQNLMGDWGNQTDLGEASHVQHLVRQSMLGLQNIVGVQFYPTVDGASETVETLQVRVRSARVQVVAGKKYQIEAELTQPLRVSLGRRGMRRDAEGGPQLRGFEAELHR